jgi:hypothetical protein
MLGRALRIGLTFRNEQCTGQITTLVHLGLKKDQDTIYSEFRAAAIGDANEVASALCIIPRAMSYASSRAKAVLQDAEQQAQAHPSSSLLAFAVVGRRVQEDTIGRFLDEVVKRVITEAGTANQASVPACTILMYQEFFACWMAPVFSYTFCDDLEQQWRQQAQTSAHHAPGGASGMSVTPKSGGDPSANGGGGGGSGSPSGKTADGAGAATQGQATTPPELRVWQTSRGSSRRRPSSHNAAAWRRGATHSAGCPRSRGRFH